MKHDLQGVAPATDEQIANATYFDDDFARQLLARIQAEQQRADSLQREKERLEARLVLKWLGEKPEAESFDEGYQAATDIIKGLVELRYTKLKADNIDDETIVKDLLAVRESLLSDVSHLRTERDSLAAIIEKVRGLAKDLSEPGGLLNTDDPRKPIPAIIAHAIREALGEGTDQRVGES